MGTVKFENDHVAKVMGYSDYKIGNVTISRVYFVEGLWHNLFSVGQFCDSDLEVAFRQHTCFIRNLNGVDLLTGSRGNNLYTLSRYDGVLTYLSFVQGIKDQVLALALPFITSKLCENLGKLQPNTDIGIFIVQAESTGSPSSTPVDQDAPSPSKSQTTPKTQSSVIPQDVEEDIHDTEVAHMGNDPLFGVPILEVTSTQSSSMISPHIIVQSDHQIPQHNSK
nr:integrase, catalytic region, zinc finger, CCHC-type, peptidase aspartic, catalytic [Tanacetum cinerariifolium]